MISAFEACFSVHGRLRAAIAACILCVAPLAHAEDAETRTAARDLATQGGQAFDAGHYERAADFFRRAYDLVHAPSIGIMQARSLVKLGQLVEAIDAYEQTARFKLAPGAPDAYVKAVKSAQSELEEVRARVPRVKITLTNTDANETPQVTIDDKPTPAALLGVERPLNPGTHQLVISVGEETRATRELTVQEGQIYSLEIDAGAHGARAVVTQTPAKEEPKPRAVPLSLEPSPNLETRPSSSSSRMLGYVGVGVGAVGLGIGTYSGLVALHHKSELDDACHPQCPRSSAGDLSGFRTNRTVSWISYGVGAAAATAGILWLTLGDSKHEQVSLGVWPGGVQIGGKL